MGVAKINPSFLYTCDRVGCRTEHIQENANDQYPEGVPPGWVKLNALTTDARHSEMFLCEACGTLIQNALFDVGVAI